MLRVVFRHVRRVGRHTALLRWRLRRWCRNGVHRPLRN
jgi:hypothetical protein